MPKAFPQEFRQDVIQVALSRPKGVSIAQIATDFGIHEGTLHKWLSQQKIEDGAKPGLSRADQDHIRELSCVDPSITVGYLNP
ncbi:hypothetical protein [Arcanobacterium phocae]|uniref:hypothetical protein n=1 Tax=Arcanobacterium phocae TaxID=131112 RepID=UPI0020A11D84|nr:hypothetical protein [Arcanobacterium phocae]